MKKTFYAPEIEQFILNNYKQISNADLARKVNAEFGSAYTQRQIIVFKHKRRLKSGFRVSSGYFKKGHSPWNKGLKGWSVKGGEKTRFKKGCTPHNTRPSGSERTVAGYVEVKIAEPNKWQLKHRLVYEKAHGAIPNGCTVMFLDGNRFNFDPANLALVSRSQNVVINRHLKLSANPDINKVKITQSALLIAVAGLKKRMM